jgi:tetratricopeptide (TPR) repeat protein
MSTDEVSKGGLKRCRRAWLAGFLVVAAALGTSAWLLWRPSVDELMRASRAALDRGETDKAQRLIRRALMLSPDSAQALLTAGEIELSLDRPNEALPYFARVANDGSAAAITAASKAGTILLGLRRVSEAESYYRRVVASDPENLTAHRRLARVLILCGRREAAVHYLELVRHGEFHTHELALLGNPEDYFEYPELSTIFDLSIDGDRQLAVGAAHYSLHKHETSEAERQFRKLAVAEPNDVDVQAGWGAALVEICTPGEFYNWHAQLPPAADAHPVIWVSRARWAQKNDERDVAIRCYWEAMERDPNDWHTNYQLGLLLDARGDRHASQAYLDRSERLRHLLDALYTLHLRPERRDLMLEAAKSCESLGRLWEACGWYRAAAALRPDLTEAQREVNRLRGLLHADSPQTLVAGDQAMQLDLSRFPLPSWPKSSPSRGQEAARTVSPPRARVAFTDLAEPAGIDFTYYNGDAPDLARIPTMPASMGGGVAILDFDGDGWPDIHFTQGCDWPPQPAQDRHLDRLFRNRGDGRFEDVTVWSGVGDNGYSRGVTVGDYNADGFADLYIANVGLNRLYRNNGDGTFDDATSDWKRADSVWTASCLLADLNGDAFPDLYDVTYLAGREPLERVCHDDVKGSVRACTPRVFAAEPDRLFLNGGDGSFSDVSQQAGILAQDGKGLGIVAADFRNEARLDLFVANDTTANFFFVNATFPPGAPPAFIESALISGCAYDSLGRSRASMGVAIDDVDGDGLFDLYVTTFYHESYMLFLGQPGGLFVDRTGEAGLKEPSLQMLGFGTQFLDADLDGWPDLVVTNGHIDDLTEAGTPYRMPAQFFRNRGFGSFEELRSAELGVFFARRQLGRSLARLDFNRDGREDFVVSHLDTPAALVANCTSGAGHFFSLQLHGVESNRDAIGTNVGVVAGGRTRWKQLTAGDGYQASNQRQLVFGLGEQTSIERLIVRWPSGREQRFSQVAADNEFILVEGRTELFRRPAP